MKINLKYVTVLFCIAAPCFAGMSPHLYSHSYDERYVSPGVEKIKKSHDKRRERYNHNPHHNDFRGSIKDFTSDIDQVLKCKENVRKRALTSGEIFSFVTKVDGDGKKIDTRHLLADSTKLLKFTRAAMGKDEQWRLCKIVENWEELLLLLVEQKCDDVSLHWHVEKLINFTSGSIPAAAV